MKVVDLQVFTEEEGIGYHIHNSTFVVDLVEDVKLADMIEEAKTLLDTIDTYMNEKIEEIREDNEDDCDMC